MSKGDKISYLVLCILVGGLSGLISVQLIFGPYIIKTYKSSVELVKAMEDLKNINVREDTLNYESGRVKQNSYNDS